MAKIVVVTSGKGGVGKTTTSASFATGLALRGYKTVIIDFDVGLRNLDLIMGCENRIVYDFVDVISGNARLSQALVKDKQLSNLFILPASQTRDKDALTDEGVKEVIEELSKQFDYIVCDSPAGIERGAQLAMYYADEAIIVTNPEISSVRDSDRIIGILQSRTKKVEEGLGSVREHLVINRYNADRAERGEMMDIHSISNDILKVPLLGVIPESDSVLEASNQGEPVILNKESKAGQTYDDMVSRFLGEERPYRHIEVKKKSFLQRWFGGEVMKKGFWSSLFGSEPKSSSANTAAERLKVIVASENRLHNRLTPERIEKMKREILAIVNNYVSGVNVDDVNIQHHAEANMEVLEMNISLPDRR